MSDYSIDFCILSSGTPSTPAVLVDTFLHGLAAHIKDTLVAYDIPSLMGPLIWVDLRVQDCRRERLQISRRVPDRAPSSACSVGWR